MGSRGFSLLSKPSTSNVNISVFGLTKATKYSGGVSGTGLEKPGANKVTLKVKSTKERDVVFQFKLTKDNNLSIRGYSPNQPEIKAHVETSSVNPSITKLTASSDKTVKSNALKLIKLMGMSETINEGVLSNIANTLKNKKKRG